MDDIERLQNSFLRFAGYKPTREDLEEAFEAMSKVAVLNELEETEIPF